MDAENAAAPAEAVEVPAAEAQPAEASSVPDYPLITEISLPKYVEPRRTQEQAPSVDAPPAEPAVETAAVPVAPASSPGQESLEVPASQASEALVSEQDSTLSGSTTARRAKHKDANGKTFRQVGTELVEMRTLTKVELEESADRLSKPKAIIEASTVRPKTVQLKYKFDKSLRGGKGGFAEVLVPAKKTPAAEKQEFMVKLAERCAEQKEKTLEKLKEKYLGPLNPNSKKVHKGEETNEHLAKLDRLYHGQGVVEGKGG